MRIGVLGALGEVGRTLSAALETLGHHVIGVSSRAPILTHPAIISSSDLVATLESGGVDLLVNAAGPGDRRPEGRAAHSMHLEVLESGERCGVPSVLISTTRVLEGVDGSRDEEMSPEPRSPYAEANAKSEEAWLAHGGSCVLRMSNYLAPPKSWDSPQAGLLPWSLVTEALATGEIIVRSAPESSREFVSSLDVARALVMLGEVEDLPRLCAAAPGVSLTMGELVSSVIDVVRELGVAAPEVTFGEECVVIPGVNPGWLSSRGWRSDVSPEMVTAMVASWLREPEISAAWGKMV